MKRNKKNKKTKYEILKTILVTLIIFVLFFLTYLTINTFIKNNSQNNSNTLIPIIYSEGYSDYSETYTSTTTNETINPMPETATTTDETSVLEKEISIISKSGKYVEVIDSCDAHFGGVCVRARVCPSTECPVATSLRNGMVLKTDGETVEAEGITWYHIVFDEWVRYSDRLPSELYVAADYLKEVEGEKARYAKDSKIELSNTKKIIIDRSERKLYAYDGEDLFMEAYVSTGLDDSPTPRGNFYIYEKTPSRYMQGPLPGISEQYYDLPGVPWTMYFTYQGGAIHGAYWHENFGSQWSHGCVNLAPADSEKLYEWADLGTPVVVRD